MKFNKWTLAIILLACIVSVYIINISFIKGDRISKLTQSASGSTTLSSQAEWTSGTNTNTKLDDPAGAVRINDLAIGNPVFGSAGNATYNGEYVESGTYGGHTSYTNGTRWLYWTGGPTFWWALGETPGAIAYYRSGFEDPLTNPWSEAPPFPPEGTPFPDVSAYSQATHTTGATQIDGGANFWEWEDFTPTDTEPANTSITYEYRTSTDGATWTAWVADISLVTSRSGEDKYRYLQVEATLANIDGASTPTIDSYDIGYHTEVKPTKPTAQTAVIE